MGNNTYPISTQELKEFTNYQFKTALPVGNTKVNYDSMTPKDAKIAIKYFEKRTKIKLHKGSSIGSIFGSTWQGIINDLKPESYKIIRDTISQPFNKTSMEAFNEKGSLDGVNKNEIIIRLY